MSDMSRQNRSVLSYKGMKALSNKRPYHSGKSPKRNLKDVGIDKGKATENPYIHRCARMDQRRLL